MKIEKKAQIHYILIYLLIISQGSVLTELFPIGFLLLCFLISLLFILRKFDLHKVDINIVLILLLTFYLLFVCFYTGGSLSVNSIGRIISILLLAYTVYHFDEKNFTDRFVRTVYFFSIISVGTFVAQLISPEMLYKILPDYLGTGAFYGGILTTVVRSHITRSCGLATEPGRHQIYLITALFLLLFRRDQIKCSEKKKNFLVWFFVLVVGIAQSTTGYLALILLLFFFVTIRNKKDDHRSEDKLKQVLWIVGFAVIVYSIIGGTDTFIYRNLITKLFLNGKVNLFQNTGTSRMGSMLTDFSLALKNPIGMGYAEYESIWFSSKIGTFGDKNSCCGFTIFLATCGFVGTFIMLCIYGYNCKRNMDDFLEKILVWLLLINLSLGQPCLYYAPMLIIFMVGKQKKGNVSYENNT